ncbi:MAG: SusC/RagA family TonB-linked outer membrane protein, partial [Chitinophagaceae bacterium]
MEFYINRKLFKATKLLFIFLTAFCIQVSASTAFSQRISISQKNMPLEQVLKEIKRQTGYFFLYDTDLVQQQSKPVNINVKNAELKEVLVLALKSQPFSYEIKENTILIMPSSPSTKIQKAIDVIGRVVDENGAGMPGASVKVKGTAIVAATDANGNFSLKNIAENATLVISYLGYGDREVAAKANLGTISLSPVSNMLANVVITGYTTYTKTQSASASSTVTSDKINEVPGLTVDQILQGRVPGMSVISTSGQPGQSASVVIRGIGSVNGSSTPLFVLDGIPIEAGYFQTINPEDIESATVLKDASAKALYGSRGSNGVVVLTTKKGKAGKVAVGYTSQYGFSNLSRPNFEMMNTAERLTFEEEVGVLSNRNIGPGWTYSPKNPTYATATAATRARADFIIDSLRKIDTDWRDIFFQRGKFQEQQVSLNGGSDKFKFYNSLNYYQQEGVAKRTGLDRYALRSNLDFKDDKFTGSVNVSLGYSQSSFTEGEGGTGAGTSMASVYYALPYEAPYASDGTLVHPGNRSSYFILDQREGTQGLERLLNSSNKVDQLKSIIGTSFAYQILPALKISTRAGIDYRNSIDQEFINPDSYYGSRSVANTLGGRGRLTDANRRNFNVISTTGLTYAKTIGAKHDFEVSGFYEYVYNNYNSFGFSAYGLDGRLPETPAGSTNGSTTFLASTTGGKSKSALASFMGVGRYTFDEKYTLTGSYRYDGSTKVAPQNKWHGFYSIGASWNAKAEDFLKSVDFVSDLRFRTSYGTTASPFGGDFTYLPTYSVSTTYGGVSGIRPVSAGNANFDWEY